MGESSYVTEFFITEFHYINYINFQGDRGKIIPEDFVA